MADRLEYAVVRRERRYVVVRVPDGVVSTKATTDRYVTSTRLRLREVREDDGTLVAEIDDGDDPSDRVPGWSEVDRQVTHDETWTGARLAR